MFLSFLFANLVFLALVRIYCWLTCGICKCSRHMVGKTVIVTGANSGIGFETAKDLSARGARLIIACRSDARGTEARDKIIKVTGNKDVHFRRLDLGSLASIRAFAANIISSENQLHVLINNAGISGSVYEETEDGLLAGMQVNYFGPFLLTSLLLPLLKSSAPSRIINVASMAHQRGQIDLDDLNWEKGNKFNSFQVYSNSKLCNVLMTAELDRRLKGTGVTANSLHPGCVETSVLDLNHMGPLRFLAYIVKVITKSPWEGAQTSIYLAVSPEVAKLSGRYFRDCFEVSPSQIAQDQDIARQLWETSEKIVGLK